jgi:hypothetical protein
MKYMIIVKATQDSEAGVMPEEKMFAAMAEYHEALQEAGALVDASGLQPSSKGFRVRYTGDKRSLIDGPFVETKELIAGYTLIRVDSAEEAADWAMRFPNPYNHDGEIEVRRLYELDDFEPSAAIDRFRKMEASEQVPGTTGASK